MQSSIKKKNVFREKKNHIDYGFLHVFNILHVCNFSFLYLKDDECRDIVLKEQVSNKAMIEEPGVQEYGVAQ